VTHPIFRTFIFLDVRSERHYVTETTCFGTMSTLKTGTQSATPVLAVGGWQIIEVNGATPFHVTRHDDLVDSGDV